MGGHLVCTGLLSILLGRAMLRAEDPRLILQVHRLEREIALGGQLSQMSSLGIEVIIHLISCAVDQEDRGWRRRETETGKERREREKEGELRSNL